MEKLIKHNMTVQYHEKGIKKKINENKNKKNFLSNVKQSTFLFFFCFFIWMMAF